MRSAFVRLVAGFTAVVIACTSYSARPDGETVVLRHEVRIAFYEAAPRDLVASMRRAVDTVGATRRRLDAPGSDAPAETQWLCDGTRVRFLRAVNVLGDRYRIGFVCRFDSVTPNLRYYTGDMFADSTGCIPISYSSKTNHNVVNE
jgi:hypothetical protein